jgi:amidase
MLDTRVALAGRRSIVFGACLLGATAPMPAEPFVLHEASVASIHAALQAGTLSCVSLVRQYLERIEAFDRQGPALRAILTVNRDALRIAEMDRQWRADKAKVGPLHGIPIILKDNFNTADMPTSGGNVAMRHSQPAADAFTVARMRQAGALILAKSNLQELARGGVSISSLGGQTLNPYDLTRNAGGSSGGTGAAIAANFAVLGTGSDTGQSIRSPASANSLVGIRPTRGLVSRAGVMPNSSTQDEVGPMARTVTDAARLFDVMVGFDPNDPITALGVGRSPSSYTQGLRADALRGARVGVMVDLYGREARHAQVNAVMERTIAKMQALGATMVRFELPLYDSLAPVLATDQFEARTVFDQYLAALGPGAPFQSFRQLVDSKTASPDIQKTLEAEVAIDDGPRQPAYKDRMLSRETLRIAVAAKMAELRVDAILYPLQRVLVSAAGQPEQPERNGTLSNGTGFPAVTFPAGFSSPTASAPIGVPVGAELLGGDYSEAHLLALAYAYEQATRVRQPPRSTPPLR